MCLTNILFLSFVGETGILCYSYRETLKTYMKRDHIIIIIIGTNAVKNNKNIIIVTGRYPFYRALGLYRKHYRYHAFTKIYTVLLS